MTDSDMPYLHGLTAAVLLLRGKWHLPVMVTLITDRRRFSDLLAAVNANDHRRAGRPLGEKVLTDTLRLLVADELVARSGSGDQPFDAVWYELTELGRSLLQAVRPLAQWAQQHPHALDAVASRRQNGRSVLS